MGWARKTELLPALMVRVPAREVVVVVGNSGKRVEPILPDALRVTEAALIVE